MGEVVNLPTGRKRERLVQQIRTNAVRNSAANDEKPTLHARLTTGAKHFALAILRSALGELIGLVGHILRLIRPLVSLALVLSALTTLVLFFIGSTKGAHDPKLILPSIACTFFFLAASGAYGRLVRALFNLEHKVKGDSL
ncbi:hypothetical protein ACM7US_29895 [Pseudomonas aeruginosa]|uniref:hypothetical protein n=1 Tax=Pseudomonas aeruginosa TaxID=287 RepID=UPI0021E2731A|nr:hypothetical protein [Pseudomonas aeruginosa]MCV0164076.1 hypothetical protein [Pseudomonas aeruginosa]HEJ4164804.1 hypothetical protein [Pseudomonas aeruginosa]